MPRRGALDHIADVGEVPCLLAVAEDPDRLAAQDGVAEPAERHVGPLSRPEHGEQPERDHVDAEVGVVEEAHVLGGELRDSVRRVRPA